MYRLVPAFASALIAASLSGAAMAADYGDPLRGAYPDNCCFDDYSYESPLEFEIGLGYWYTWGQHGMGISGNGIYSRSDNSHILEGHFRIDDNSTNSYLRGTFGHSFIINNSYTTPSFATTQTSGNGTISYGIADFGMMPLGLDTLGMNNSDGDARVGAFVGYQYIYDNPDMGRVNFRTSSGGFDSQVNQIDIHAIRIGAVGRVEFGDFELNAQAALIPWASITGTYGAFTASNVSVGGTTYQQGSAGYVSGSLWGGAGEVTVGYSPHDNIKIKAGARAYYLTGTPQIRYTGRDTTNPANSLNVIQTVDNFSLFRYGPTAEIAVTF